MRILVSFDNILVGEKYEIICHHKYQLNKLELQKIVIEISQVLHSTITVIVQAIGAPISLAFNSNMFSLDKAQRYVDINWCGQMGHVLQNTTTFERIPTNRHHLPYAIECERDFDIDESVKPEYQTVFKSSKLPPCRFMEKKKQLCLSIKTKDNQFIGKRSKQENILKHLSNFDHFEYFGKKKPMCDYHKDNKTCIHFENVLNNKNTMNDNFDEYFNDYRHLYLYFHRTNNRQQGFNHGSSTFFKFLSLNDATGFEYQRYCDLGDYDIRPNANYSLLALISEVIKNGFEKDLLPRNDADLSVKQLIKNTVNRYSGDKFARGLNFDPIRKQLVQNYKIFDILDEKMNHRRHKQMGCPLY